MSIGNLVASHLLGLFIESAFSHLGTKRTGIGFLADIKEDRADFCGDDFIWNLKFPAHSCHRFQIHIAKPQIHRNGAQFIFFRVKPPQMMKGMEQCQAVLSAGHSYGDTVTVLNQPVCIKSLACQAQKTL